MILKEGLNVRVATFPDGDDPDSFARKHSSEEIQKYIADNAKDFIRYKTSLLLEEVGDDPLKRAGLIRSIVESIALIPDAIKRSVFVQECAQIMRMTESVLLLELNKALRIKTDKAAAQPAENTEPVPQEAVIEEVVETRLNADAQERELVRVLLQYGNHGMEIEYYNAQNEQVKEVVAVADYILAELEADSIELFSPVFGKMLLEYQAEIKDKAVPDIQVFVNHEDELLRKEASDILANPHQVSDNWKILHNIEPESEEVLVGKAARDVVYRVKLRHIQLKSEQVREELEVATDDAMIFFNF
jgi:DNA primase